MAITDEKWRDGVSSLTFKENIQEYDLEDRSWYILTILIRKGSPSSPVELSKQCKLFYISSSEVEELCHRRNSPICMNESQKVTCSDFSVDLFHAFNYASNPLEIVIPDSPVSPPSQSHKKSRQLYFSISPQKLSTTSCAVKNGSFYSVNEECRSKGQEDAVSPPHMDTFKTSNICFEGNHFKSDNSCALVSLTKRQLNDGPYYLRSIKKLKLPEETRRYIPESVPTIHSSFVRPADLSESVKGPQIPLNCCQDNGGDLEFKNITMFNDTSSIVVGSIVMNTESHGCEPYKGNQNKVNDREQSEGRELYSLLYDDTILSAQVLENSGSDKATICHEQKQRVEQNHFDVDGAKKDGLVDSNREKKEDCRTEYMVRTNEENNNLPMQLLHLSGVPGHSVLQSNAIDYSISHVGVIRDEFTPVEIDFQGRGLLKVHKESFETHNLTETKITNADNCMPSPKKHSDIEIPGSIQEVVDLNENLMGESTCCPYGSRNKIAYDKGGIFKEQCNDIQKGIHFGGICDNGAEIELHTMEKSFGFREANDSGDDCTCGQKSLEARCSVSETDNTCNRRSNGVSTELRCIELSGNGVSTNHDNSTKKGFSVQQNSSCPLRMVHKKEHSNTTVQIQTAFANDKESILNLAANELRTDNADGIPRKEGINLGKSQSNSIEQTSHRKASTLKKISSNFPNFEGFRVLQQEGSGGFGVVYKVKRREDDKVFAIKCPLQKTPKSSATNEINMLQRFGGNDFIIKQEGVIQCNALDCLILEYFPHDKPEILKKQVNILELRWYGFCLFKALDTLHKKGVIHRDVKPGNFIFSRGQRRGFLIDFNLAIDEDSNGQCEMHKYRGDISLKSESTASFVVENRHTYFVDDRRKKLKSIQKQGLTKQERSMTTTPHKMQFKNKTSSVLLEQLMKRKTMLTDSLPNAHRTFGQDISNIKSKNVLDPRSVTESVGNETSAGAILKEPLPTIGRRELLNLIREIQHESHQQNSHPRVYNKKQATKVHEFPTKEAQKNLHQSQACLEMKRNSRHDVCGFPKRSGKEKRRKYGPCVGTKGYRAPEVLLRSTYQTCKLDIWSAGVTLLELIIGKTPFPANSNNQALCEIAKFCGAEELWELSKLHDCQSSFPVDLVSRDNDHVTLEQWCVKNTRRPEFLPSVPLQLYDLVKKCLCVNPRKRISAREALHHEFFSSCCKI